MLAALRASWATFTFILASVVADASVFPGRHLLDLRKIDWHFVLIILKVYTSPWNGRKIIWILRHFFWMKLISIPKIKSDFWYQIEYFNLNLWIIDLTFFQSNKLICKVTVDRHVSNKYMRLWLTELFCSKCAEDIIQKQKCWMICPSVVFHLCFLLMCSL